MARNLYRFYLYTVSIVLLIFATSIGVKLLATLLALTPIRGISAAPGQPAIVQAIVFASAGWLISGLLIGLHYWLIRRDIHSDPGAETSVIRAFYLNIPEAIGVLILVPLLGFFVLNGWTLPASEDLSGPLSVALPVLVMVLLLELERRRTSQQTGSMLIFQRLHVFGVQLMLLLLATGTLFNNLRALADTIFFKGQGAACGLAQCSPLYSLGLILPIFWFVFCWLIYCLLTRTDRSRNTRIALHGIGLAIGISYLLAGIYITLELLLLPFYHISIKLSDVLGTGASYDFVTPLLVGLLITGVYHFLLLKLPRKAASDQIVRSLTEQAIAGVLLAGTFWAGIGDALYNLLQLLAPPHSLPGNASWITTLALILTGSATLLVDRNLRKRYAQDTANALGARRGFVLALLGAAILTLAISGVTALYAWGTAILGAPIDNWHHLAHIGLAGTLVGAIVLTIYLWRVRQEHLLSAQSRPVPPEPETPASIERVLDELLSNQITRDEAKTRLEDLQRSKPGEHHHVQLNI